RPAGHCSQTPSRSAEPHRRTPPLTRLRPHSGPPSFFFQCHGAHRHLHSFPTRRSSDLSIHVRSGAMDHSSDSVVSAASATKASRSEEHTSELQSQSNLVCRLLLEKKKTKKRHT